MQKIITQPPGRTPSQLPEADLRRLFMALTGEEAFVFLESTRITPENHRSFLFRQPRDLLVCQAGDDPDRFLGRAQEFLGQGYYLAGWLGYEFGYLLEPALAARFKPATAAPLAVLGVFGQPHIYDHGLGTFAGAGPWPVAAHGAAGVEPPYEIRNLRLNQSLADYLATVERIKAYIESGDTYQVNYTIKFRFDFSGSVPAFYRALRRNQRVCFGAFLKLGGRQVISFSPELFFSKQGEVLTVRPMKGTIGRGRTVAEDEALARFLKNDLKNRSENVMIVDLLRNDLGRICPVGQGGVKVVSLFDVERYETLQQMTSTIEGLVKADLPIAEMLRALFPCGSVTGAPKIRTMEIIRELELADRGVYTGAIGYLAPDGGAAFNVPIRTVVLEEGRGEMGVGSGIVYDSEPRQEWEECRLKGRFLTEPAAEFHLIETMLWTPATGYWLLEQHLQRLADSARYFGFPLPAAAVRAALAAAARPLAAGPAPAAQRLRLTLAGDGAVEIAATPWVLPAAGLGLEVPVAGQAAGRSAPRVIFAEHRTDSHSPFLYHKTTRRALYDEERRRAVAAGFYEVLFCNEKGQVTEGSITNIFIKKEGLFITPPVECGLLAGVFRRCFIEKNPDLVKTAPLTVNDLQTAEAVYVGNSVRGLVEVTLT